MKAERLEKVEPQWVVAPSGKEFLLRATPLLASAVALHLPRTLTDQAKLAWKKEGVELKDEGETRPQFTEESSSNLRFMARVIAQGCVSPKFVANPQNEDELSIDELEDDDTIFIVQHCTGQIESHVRLQGGRSLTMADLKSVPKQPGILPRTGTDG